MGGTRTDRKERDGHERGKDVGGEEERREVSGNEGKDKIREDVTIAEVEKEGWESYNGKKEVNDWQEKQKGRPEMEREAALQCCTVLWLNILDVPARKQKVQGAERGRLTRLKINGAINLYNNFCAICYTKISPSVSPPFYDNFKNLQPVVLGLVMGAYAWGGFKERWRDGDGEREAVWQRGRGGRRWTVTKYRGCQREKEGECYAEGGRLIALKYSPEWMAGCIKSGLKKLLLS